MVGKAAATRSVKVWDAPTRLVHWLLPVLIFVSWLTAEKGRLDWHRLCGYAILGLILFRIVWGFAGSQTARFSSSVKGPRAILAYARTLPSRSAPAAPGHNPLGALSVVALLGLLATQVGLGLFAVDTDGLESGPLADRVSFEFGRACARLHHTVFNALLVLIGVHLAAVAFYLVYKRENLIGAMIGGSRVYPENAAPEALRFAPVWRILLAAAFAAGGAWMTAKDFRL